MSKDKFEGEYLIEGVDDPGPEYKKPAKTTKMDFSKVLKANPYHDKEGNFTSKDKAVAVVQPLGPKGKKHLEDHMLSQTLMSKQLMDKQGGKLTEAQLKHFAANDRVAMEYARTADDPVKKIEGIDTPIKIRVF